MVMLPAVMNITAGHLRRGAMLLASLVKLPVAVMVNFRGGSVVPHQNGDRIRPGLALLMAAVVRVMYRLIAMSPGPPQTCCC